MNLFRAILSRFRSLGQNRAVRQEIDEELRFHIEQRAGENLAAGMSPEEAAREARKRFGNFQSVREECRQTRGASFGEDFLQDVRFGLRILRKHPSFTAVAVLTLALGIGINTAMFSMLKELLFYPVPYPQPNALLRVGDANCFLEQKQADFLDEREQNTVFSDLAAFQCWLNSGNLSLSTDDAQGVSILRTTGNFFDTLEVPPVLGRTFTRENDQPGRGQVVVLSHHLWMSRFNGDTNIVGRTVRLDGNPVSILGVMPAKFASPLLFGVGGRVDVFEPLTMTTQWRQDREGPNLDVIGRLKPGVTLDQARVEMRAIGQRLKEQYPKAHAKGFWLETELWGRSLLAASGRNTFWLLLGLTGLVLLIACANLTNLQLARMAGRLRELGIRVSLGAGRARVARQLLTENLVLSLLGGASGLILAFACDRFLANQFSTGYGFSLIFPVDRYVIIFTLLIVMLTTMLVGVAPAWLVVRAGVNPSLKENSRGSSGGRSRHRLQSAFVIIQIGLALALLATTGEVTVTLFRQALRNPGWRPEGLWTARINMAQPAYYDSTQKQMNFFRQLEGRVSALPGVSGISWCSALPFQHYTNMRIKIEGRPDAPSQQGPIIFWHQVGPDFFKTMGMMLRQGRDFTRDEIKKNSPVVIINQAMANRFWPGKNPVGQRITSALFSNMGWFTIIGVVNDFAGADGYHIYWPPSGFPLWTLVIRSRSTPQTMAPALRQIVAGIDPNLPVSQLEPASRVFARSQAASYAVKGLIIAFGILGLFLAVIGVYGVTAYTVSQRTGEFGVRMALGAQHGDILWLILQRGLWLSLLGTVVGIAGAIGVLRVLAALMPDESPTGPSPAIFAGISETGWLIIIGISAVLIVAAMLACWLPARRATRIDPMTALRCE